jgi:hypothetical protein
MTEEEKDNFAIKEAIDYIKKIGGTLLTPIFCDHYYTETFIRGVMYTEVLKPFIWRRSRTPKSARYIKNFKEGSNMFKDPSVFFKDLESKGYIRENLYFSIVEFTSKRNRKYITYLKFIADKKPDTTYENFESIFCYRPPNIKDTVSPETYDSFSGLYEKIIKDLGSQICSQ